MSKRGAYKLERCSQVIHIAIKHSTREQLKQIAEESGLAIGTYCRLVLEHHAKENMT